MARRQTPEVTVQDHSPLSLRTWRRTLIAVVGGAAVLVVAGTTALSAAVGKDLPEPMARLASTTECVPSGPVKTVDDLNRISELRGEPQFKGGDVGASAKLSDGSSIWVFGDTLRTDTQGTRFVRNSMLVVEPDCLRVIVPESGGALIPDRRDGVGYWPMSVTSLAHAGFDLVVVAAQRVRTTDSASVFGFEALGPAFAQFIVPNGGVPQLLSVTDLGADDSDTRQPMWGAAAAQSEGWLYLYGTSREPVPQMGTGFAMRVARAPVDRVQDQTAWTYWTGSEWSSSKGAAVEVIGDQGGVSQTLSVFAQDGRWFAFSKRNEVLGQDLVFWTAPAPAGPFSAAPAAAELPSGTATGELRYMPLAHPDLLPESGSVVISYSRNNTDLGKVLDDPLLYRPAFLRLPLPN